MPAAHHVPRSNTPVTRRTSPKPTMRDPVLDAETCWSAVLERDASADGRFLYGVVTTGVFCRPTCPSRRPKRQNVRFYRTAAEAEADGLRACLRCRPTEPAQADDAEEADVRSMSALCDFIRAHADSGDALTLDRLAEKAGMSTSRLRRVFRRIVGVTPRQYVEVCRFETLKDGLREGRADDGRGKAEVTRAIYDAGFGSSSRVYEQASSHLGMTPSQYRDGGKDLEISYAVATTPLGPLLVAATDRGLCAVRFAEGDVEDEGRAGLVASLEEEYPRATLRPMADDARGPFRQWVDALVRHLEGGQPHLDLPVDVRATAFQERVWRYLRSIPAGETRTYSRVARDLGMPRGARAVARACASNRVALAIPCHRVLRADGGLGGYRWGLERKRRLLDAESAGDAQS